MTSIVNGCNIYLTIDANELESSDYLYTLPTGYSINTINITNVTNITNLNSAYIKNGARLIFPVVNSKSPSSILLSISDTTRRSSLKFTIEKFGQIPDEHYFDSAFEPILVMGDDGNNYPVIPSDQFK